MPAKSGASRDWDKPGHDEETTADNVIDAHLSQLVMPGESAKRVFALDVPGIHVLCAARTKENVS
jgi:hypothetical protein